MRDLKRKDKKGEGCKKEKGNEENMKEEMEVESRVGKLMKLKC